MPSHSPLKQNLKYHIQMGAGKGIFKISQHNGFATLHIAKDKVSVTIFSEKITEHILSKFNIFIHHFSSI